MESREKQEGWRNYKGTRQNLYGVIEMFALLIVVMVLWVNTHNIKLCPLNMCSLLYINNSFLKTQSKTVSKIHKFDNYLLGAGIVLVPGDMVTRKRCVHLSSNSCFVKKEACVKCLGVMVTPVGRFPGSVGA